MNQHNRPHEPQRDYGPPQGPGRNPDRWEWPGSTEGGQRRERDRQDAAPGQGQGEGGYGRSGGGYGTGGYGSAGDQRGYGGAGFGGGGGQQQGHAGNDENQGYGSQGHRGGGPNDAGWGEGWGGGRSEVSGSFGGSSYGQPSSYGPRDPGGRQGWGAGGYRDEGMGLSIQGYGSTGYGRGTPDANATWGAGGTQHNWPDQRPEPHQREGGPQEPSRRPWRAPQGYQRSDQRIYEDLCDRLAEHPHVDPRSMSVKVEQCVVTLEGTVATRREKHLAEDLADAIPGVKDVLNHLRVGRADQPARHDKSDVIGTPEGNHMISREAEESHGK